ncbi:ABC transporter substrate-binding protein [Bacillus manliponensis]|uniref:ABC transporter substrate-binding protein n=1 Tax=Bacillus manliponensis TaxID=574376 RepID=A0A073JXW0_9BACI|nr:SgrR family transcriptional regulator [Bacillus manliponensis]KEK19115.1 ABC transporter substrate-binding protein [Bacillus manliponensis]
MKIMEHYIRLRLSFQDEQHIQKSLQELADVLFCSTKNVKLLLRKMSNEQLIAWIPGRGRGNKTEITFLHNFSSCIEDYAKKLLENDKLQDVFVLLKEPLPAALHHKIEDMLHQHFGYGTTNEMYDVLKIPRGRKLLPLDPAFVGIATESHLISQIVDTLVIYNEETDTIEPHLAHSWEVSEDQTRWTFYLRKGVRFHHGTMLSSKDVVFSFERLQQVNSPYRWLTDHITHIEMPSPLQVTFHLRKPNLFFLHFVSSVQLSVLPHDVTVEDYRYIGTGPFKIKTFNEDNLTLEAFPDYFKERALLDEIQFWFVPDAVKAGAHYEVPNITDEEEREVQIEEVGCIYAAFNFNKDGPHHDIFFRKAWREILDAKAYIDELGGMRTIPSYSFFPNRSRTKYEERSLYKAKEHLQKSCYNGETIHIYFFEFKTGHEDALWMQNKCEQLGIKIELHPFPVTDYLDDSIEKQADMILMGEIFDSNIEMAFLNVFQNKTCFIERFMSDDYKAKVYDMLQTFLTEPNKETRYDIMYEIEEYLQKEHVIHFLHHLQKKKSYPVSLQNVTIDSFGWTDFAKLWIRP